MTGDEFGVTSGGQAARDAAEHARFEFDDAPYVLGALDEEECASYERHLATCPLCRQQVASLRDMPAVLRRADPSVWEPEPLPATLLPSLLRQVEVHRRRRYWRTLTTGLVAACLLVSLGVAAFRSLPGDDGPQLRVLQPVSQVGQQVRATVVLTRGKTGTNLRLTCDYVPKPPFPLGAVPKMYRLVIFNKAGDQQWPASWPPAPSIEITAMSSWSQQNIGRIEIEDEQGDALLRLVL